jgi:hypothetical protein
LVQHFRRKGEWIRSTVATKAVGAGYLTAIGARFVSGRDLTAADEAEAISPLDVVERRGIAASTGAKYIPPQQHPAVVVDTNFANRLWPGGQALGQTFVPAQNGVRYSVVGVVEPLRFSTAHAEGPSMFEAQALVVDLLRPQHFIARAAGTAEAERMAVTGVVRQAFPDPLQLSVRDARSLIAEERSRERMGATVFSWFGVAAAILGLAGTYGLVAFLALRQRRELGIRAALGAGKQHLVRVVASRAVMPSLVGAVIGVLLALWVSKGLSTIVAGVSNVTPWPALWSGAGLVAASAVTALVAARGLRHLREADLLREP